MASHGLRRFRELYKIFSFFLKIHVPSVRVSTMSEAGTNEGRYELIEDYDVSFVTTKPG